MRRTIGGVAILAAALLMGNGCTSTEPDAQQSERAAQQSNYEQLSKMEPAQDMQHPMTRITVNKWIDTWDEPGKLAYVYLQGANGELLGYYVMEGLPVSYCVSLTPNYRIENEDHQGPGVVVPAPAMDGVYYGGDGSCNTYYGFDAVTGAYLEYTAGLGINVLLYDQPLPRQDVQPLGFSTIDDVEEAQE